MLWNHRKAVGFVCRKCSGFTGSTEDDEDVTPDGDFENGGKVLIPERYF